MAVENNAILPVTEGAGDDFNRALEFFLKVQSAIIGDGDLSQPLPEGNIQLSTVGGWLESLQDLVESIDKESFQNKLDLEDGLDEVTRSLEELQQIAHENSKVKNIHSMQGMKLFCIEKDLSAYSDLVSAFADVSENF